MTTPHVAASFAVDVESFATFGVVDPYGDESLALYASGRLTSEQRLLLALWGSTQLSSASFDPRQRIATQGEAIAAAYVIIAGQALGVLRAVPGDAPAADGRRQETALLIEAHGVDADLGRTGEVLDPEGGSVHEHPF